MADDATEVQQPPPAAASADVAGDSSSCLAELEALVQEAAGGGAAEAAAEEAEGEAEPDAAGAAGAAAAVNEQRGGTAIIVPYRDLHPEQQRGQHLQRFLEAMPRLLAGGDGKGDAAAPATPFHIYIVEQSDDGRKFNRGKLLNIGFQLAARAGDHDVYVFHDVDLLPSKELLPYYRRTPAGGPVHIARVWGRYSGNPKYIGGAVAFTSADFRRINGFPNTFWGWGGEDDEMRRRIDEERLQVSAPPAGSMEDMEEQSLEAKLQTLRAHRDWKCNVKWEALNEHAATWRRNGLEDLDYEVLATERLGPHATKHTVDVKLNGHWTDTVHEAPPSNDHQNSNRGRRGGRGGGWHRGGGRGGGGGGGASGDRGYEPDPKRRRHG